MKNRVFFLIGLWVAFLLSFVALIILGYAQTDSSELINPQEIIKKAFPDSKITWSKEIQGEMVNFKATSTALAIMIGNGDKRKIKFMNFKDSTEWSIDCDHKSCRYYDLVGDSLIGLLMKGIERRGILTILYNSQGEPLFKVQADSWLSHSPNLKYFHTCDNSDYDNLLEVYDSEGKFLWKRGTPHGRIWFAQTLSDSELIYLDSDECVLLDAFTGEVIWQIPSSSFDHIIHGFPAISPASNAAYFIIADVDGVVSMNSKGKILWMRGINMTVLADCISDDGKFVALYLQKPGKAGVKKLECIDNFNQGEILWSRSIETLFKEITSENHGLKFEGKELSLIPDYVSYYYEGITLQMQTLYFQIDPEDGELVNQYTIDGVCESFRTDSRRIHYLLVHKGDKKEIFRLEQELNK